MNPGYQRALIVGAGAIAIEHHLPRFFTLLGSSRVDIFDDAAPRRALLQKRFRRNDRIRILERIHDHERYDLTLIATPPRFHYELFEQLHEQATTILIEKPMTVTEEEAKALQALALETGTLVFVNLFRRTLQSFALVRGIREADRFGALEGVSLAEGDVFSWRSASLGSFSKNLSGGGVLMDTGPHALDLLFQVFDRIDLRSAFMDAHGESGAVEANCSLHLVADGKTPITVQLSRNRHLSNQACFRFADAELRAAVRDNRIDLRYNDGASHTIYPPGVDAGPPLTFAELNDQFYRRFLLSGDNSSVDATQSRKSIRLIDEAYRIAQPMRGGF